MMDAARSGVRRDASRLGIRASRPAADLIEVPEEIGRIFIDPTGAGSLELVAAVYHDHRGRRVRAARNRGERTGYYG
jgi:hypothetical protein